ncbi:hypothetical protein GCM10023170_090520 [Phytohabitans houttuyneae]|uniref:Uncharacterized protein n=1 Tax=Phytohabitans houttuyneae TaxID=1076126 RepID=A0A6V8KA11_9ACTN|nr:hypothetical protein Phou_062330 [Phytohabitans houttuyneae]
MAALARNVVAWASSTDPVARRAVTHQAWGWRQQKRAAATGLERAGPTTGTPDRGSGVRARLDKDGGAVADGDHQRSTRPLAADNGSG